MPSSQVYKKQNIIKIMTDINVYQCKFHFKRSILEALKSNFSLEVDY